MTRCRPTFIARSRVSRGGSVASRVATRLIRPHGYMSVSPHLAKRAWLCLHLINHLGAAQYHRVILSICRPSRNHLLSGIVHQLVTAGYFPTYFHIAKFHLLRTICAPTVWKSIFQGYNRESIWIIKPL